MNADNNGCQRRRRSPFVFFFAASTTICWCWCLLLLLGLLHAVGALATTTNSSNSPYNGRRTDTAAVHAINNTNNPNNNKSDRKSVEAQLFEDLLYYYNKAIIFFAIFKQVLTLEK